MRDRDILDNLITFLNVIEETEQNIDSDLLATIKQLLKQGHCFSFCVCQAAMEEAGLLKWWEAALQTIHFLPNEQITPDKLQDKILLPQAEDGKSITLKELFTRMVNYLLFNQSHADELWSINDSQLDYLSPNHHFFELLEEGEIKTIQQKKLVAGNFTDSFLETWLGDGSGIEGRICLVHSDVHTIRISFKDGRWKLYDPVKMFDEGCVQKEFTDKRELINKIFEIQGTALGLEIASFDKQREIVMPELQFQSVDEVVYLLKGFGLHQIANYTPDRLPSIIQLARQSKKVAEEIAYALMRKDKDKWTGLQVLATYCPEYLSEIISVVATIDYSSRVMASILFERDSDGDSGLKNLLDNCDVKSTCVAQALNIALNYEKALKRLGPLLIEKYSNNWNGLMRIIDVVPGCAYQVLETIGKTEEGIEFLSIALSHTNKEGYSGFDLLKERAPQCLSSKILSAALTIVNNKRFDSIYYNQSSNPEPPCFQSPTIQPELPLFQFPSSSSAISIFHHSQSEQNSPKVSNKKREAENNEDSESKRRKIEKSS